MKGGINNNTIIVWDFKTSLTPMDRSVKQKIIKETQTLSDTMDQLGLIDIKRTFHAKAMNFTFFSNVHETFSRIDHILGHKSCLDNWKKKNQNHFKHLFWSQCSEIRCQLQGERNYYKYKHMVCKQHASEWPKYNRKKSENKWK